MDLEVERLLDGERQPPMATLDPETEAMLADVPGVMRRELLANLHKQLRRPWHEMPVQELCDELDGHAVKLKRALQNNDVAGIDEHAGDVLNLAAMVRARFFSAAPVWRIPPARLEDDRG